MSTRPFRSLDPEDPSSLDERLAKAPQHRTVVQLNPDEAGAMYARLAELEAIRRRAEEVRSRWTVVEPDAAAHYILTGEQRP